MLQKKHKKTEGKINIKRHEQGPRDSGPLFMLVYPHHHSIQ